MFNILTCLSTQIISELVSNGVQIYQFPTDDETVADLNASMNVSDQWSNLTSQQPCYNLLSQSLEQSMFLNNMILLKV